MKIIYAEEYLCIPTSNYIRNVTRLLEEKHGNTGMHAPWKNCQKGCRHLMIVVTMEKADSVTGA